MQGDCQLFHGFILLLISDQLDAIAIGAEGQGKETGRPILKVKGCVATLKSYPQPDPPRLTLISHLTRHPIASTKPLLSSHR
jgi:hypothetical protein